MEIGNQWIGVVLSASLHIMSMNTFRLMITDAPLRQYGLRVFGYCAAAALSTGIFRDVQRHGLDACMSPHKVARPRSAIGRSGSLSV